MPTREEKLARLEELRKKQRLAELMAKMGQGSTEDQRTVLERVGQVADWTSGMGRTAFGQLMEMMPKAGMIGTGGAPAMAGYDAPSQEEAPDIIRKGEWEKALRGEAVPGEEILARMGVEEGIPRKIAGFGLEMATDPLTYGTLGLSTAAKPALKTAARFVKPVSEAAKPIGKRTFKRGVKKIDKYAAKYGKKPPSEILLREGKAGSNRALGEQSVKLADDLFNERQKLYSLIDKSGEAVDMEKAMKPVQDKINQIMKGKSLRRKKIAQRMQREINEYKNMNAVPDLPVTKQVRKQTGKDLYTGKPIYKTEEITEVIPGQPGTTVTQASDIKSSLYGDMPQASFDVLSKSETGKALLKKMAKGIKDEIEKTATRVDPNVGNQLKNINEDLGSLLTVGKKFNMEALKDSNKQWLTQVDAMLLGFGQPLPVVGKAAQRTITGPGFLTRTGRRIYEAGAMPLQSTLLDAAARTGTAQALRPETQSPWERVSLMGR